MADANMTLHCGAREVTREQLALVPCPPAEGRWKPVPHVTVLDYACKALTDAGYGIRKQRLGLSRNDRRFWGTLVLESDVVHGVSLAVAVASSIDKSVSLRWGYGHNVWVCDNGAWSVERTISRKHTTHAVVRYQEAICKAVTELDQYRQVEEERIKRLTAWEIDDTRAESLLLRCYETKLLSPQTLPAALNQWRRPDYEDFQPRTAWSLYNAVTYALNARRKTNPQAHAHATIRLNAVLSPPEARDAPHTAA
jgi:Domain of unknown function (DUF932)